MSQNTSPSIVGFMLLLRNAGADVHQHLTADQRAELAKQWNDWYDGLAALGQVQQAHPLGPQGRVVSGLRGKTITDGPYAEAKEVVGGYFFLSVTDIDEATEIAKGCPGLPLGLTVEVRPVVESSPVLEEVRGRSRTVT